MLLSRVVLFCFGVACCVVCCFTLLWHAVVRDSLIYSVFMPRVVIYFMLARVLCCIALVVLLSSALFRFGLSCCVLRCRVLFCAVLKCASTKRIATRDIKTERVKSSGTTARQNSSKQHTTQQITPKQKPYNNRTTQPRPNQTKNNNQLPAPNNTRQTTRRAVTEQPVIKPSSTNHGNRKTK